MRQLARIVMRARLTASRWQGLASAPNVAIYRGRKLLVDWVERHRGRLRKELASLQMTVQDRKNPIQEIIQCQNSSTRNLALSVEALNGFDMRRPDVWDESSIKNCRDDKGTLHSDFQSMKQNFNDALKDTMKDNKSSIKTSLNRRKQRLSEAVLVRRELLNKALQSSKDDMTDKMLHRRKILHEALESRKQRLADTELKIRERGRLIIEDLHETKKIMKEKMEQVIEKENIYTVPNLLCVTRIVFSPYLGYLIVTGNFEYALGFMVVAGVSDWLDGWIARNYPSQSSKIGSFLDPMADKVLIGTLFLTLTYVDLIPVALTALIVGRDVALVVAGFVIRYKSLPPPRTFARYFDATHATAQLAPTLVSKINTGIQLALVGSTLAAPVFGYVGHPALDYLCYITAASTVLAAASYITSKDTYRYLRRK